MRELRRKCRPLSIRQYLGQLRQRIADRSIALACLRRFRTEITFRRNGFVWTGPSSCWITEQIFLNGHYQDTYIEALAAWMRPERPVIINVGANLGDVALPLSRTGKRVLAIEPNPATFARLQHNVRQNGLTGRITCCQVAIAAEAGSADLVIAAQPGNSEIRGDYGVVGFDGVDQQCGVVPVRTIRLDDLVKSCGIGSGEIALVWSDTQGFESQVIDSGPSIWAHGTPLWVEVWPRGLDCHGGTTQFVQLCKRYFDRVVIDEQIDAAPAPIGALESIVARARARSGPFIDILLIPP